MEFWRGLYQVVDHVSTSLAVPLAVVGFWITIRQIRKTRSAAEAARDAATSAKQDINRAGILVLLPQLQRTEEHIEGAIHQNSRELFVAWANVWRWQAGQFKGYLEVTSTEYAHISELLQKSIYAVTTAKSAVISSVDGDLQRGTKKALESLSAVTNELGTLAAIFGSHVNPEIENG